MGATITFAISGIIALLFGILILAVPKFLRYAVGLYLIIIGLLQLVSISI